MNIWLLQTGEILPLHESNRKMRTGYLACELAQRKHNVLWWTSAFDHMTKSWIKNVDAEIDLVSNLKIKLIKGFGYQKNVSVNRYLDHRWIASKFSKLSKLEEKPDVIVASLPEHHLAYEAMRYSLAYRIPLIVDLRDLWPDFLVDVIKPKFIQSILKVLLLQDFYRSRFVLHNAFSLVSMMVSYQEWGKINGKRVDCSRDRTFYLGAAKPKQDPQKDKLRQEIQDIIWKTSGRFVILFIGAFNKSYQPIQLVRASRFINENFNTLSSKLAFVIAGSGDYDKEIMKEAEGLSNVWLPGWVNETEISALLEISNVGIIPTNEILSAFPNKVFTYLSGGLPVISSVVGELKEILIKEGIGYWYDYSDFKQLARIIIKMVSMPDEVYGCMVHRAMNLFDQMFDSGKIYSDFADHIEAVVREYRLNLN